MYLWVIFLSPRYPVILAIGLNSTNEPSQNIRRERVVSPVHPFRVPLHKEEERVPPRLLELHRLGDAVPRARDHPEALSRPIRRLVMAGIHRARRSPDRILQDSGPLEEHAVIALVSFFILMAGKPGLFQIRDQGSAEMHVCDLQSPADTENRRPIPQCTVEHPPLEGIALLIHIVQRGVPRTRAVENRIDVAPSAEEDAVERAGRVRLAVLVGELHAFDLRASAPEPGEVPLDRPPVIHRIRYADSHLRSSHARSHAEYYGTLAPHRH